MVAIVAHRGASGEVPENTLLAFRRALEIGVDEIELDLRMTREGHLVALHDATVDRTTDGSGAVADLTFEEIRALDAGIVFGETFRGERIPTWEDVLDLVAGKVRLNVHLKCGADPSGDFERKVAGRLRDFGIVADAILACDFDTSVARLREIDPAIECRIFPGRRTPEEYIETSVAMGLRTIQPGRAWMDRTFIEQAHKTGLAVHVFYADTPEDMRAYIALGVDGILTNHPARLKAVLAETRP